MVKKHRPCPVPGCCKVVTGRRLMCWDHWSALPMPLQTSIRDTWKRDGLAKAVPMVAGAVSLLARRAERSEARGAE